MTRPVPPTVLVVPRTPAAPEPAEGAWPGEVIARVLAEVRAAFGEPLGQPCSPAAIDTAEAVLNQLAHPVVPRPRQTP